MSELNWYVLHHLLKWSYSRMLVIWYDIARTYSPGDVDVCFSFNITEQICNWMLLLVLRDWHDAFRVGKRSIEPCSANNVGHNLQFRPPSVYSASFYGVREALRRWRNFAATFYWLIYVTRVFSFLSIYCLCSCNLCW